MSITDTYASLMAVATTTLDEQWDASRMTSEDYAKVVAATISSAMNAAVAVDTQGKQIASQESIQNNELAEKKRQFDADSELRGEKVNTQKAQTALVTRQKDAYDDRKIQEHGKAAGSFVGMGSASSGIDVGSEAWTWAKTAIDLMKS